MQLDETWTRFELNGRTFAARLEYDQDHGTPWENEDGHGEVSDWTSRDKAPGELVLSEDRRSKRFYDFAGACRTARVEGWGFLPGPLKTWQDDAGIWHAQSRHFRATHHIAQNFEAADSDINTAIRAVYAQHRATFPSARAYAAAAAMSDYDRLRAWCNDDWHYLGVIVAAVCPCCDQVLKDATESLWGIESDSEEYHCEVARELAGQIEPAACKSAAA